MCRIACMSITFLALVMASAYVGYEAGLPADDIPDNGGGGDNNGGHVITKGEEWMEHPMDHLPHLPHIDWHWNFTHSYNSKNKNSNNYPEQQRPPPPPPVMTQTQLLHLSERVFQTCSERSLLTTPGRNACLSLCHGHYCCFEKYDGSCVSDPLFYCFAYAACENAIVDFDMNNVNTVVETKEIGMGHNSHDGMLNAFDVQLLMETCERGNIATLDGIRDCMAFCQHHLCCFSQDDKENCRGDHPGECQAYEACRVLVEGPPEDGGAQAGVTDLAGSNINSVQTQQQQQEKPSPVLASHDPADIKVAVQAVCGIEGQRLDDDSWVTACQSLCADYLCCFSTDGTRSNCQDTYGEEVCSAYSGCGVLYSASQPSEESAGEEVGGSFTSSQPMTQPQQQQQVSSEAEKVNDVCSEKIQQNPSLREACRLACESRSCCYQTGPGNCYILVSIYVQV